jgi:hypothetical protein
MSASNRSPTALGRRAGHRRRDAQPPAPDRGDEQDGDEVDDAERDHRRDLGQRVHERGRDRDGDGRHHDAEDADERTSTSSVRRDRSFTYPA